MLARWIKKCEDDSETANWIAANTKVITIGVTLACRRPLRDLGFLFVLPGVP
jgi:hypothetical protein